MTVIPPPAAPEVLRLHQDGLTGLGTLLAFLTRLRTALDPEQSAALPLAIVVLELSDRPGTAQHPVSDEAILRVAVAAWTVVTRWAPQTGAAFRIKANEFALVLPGTDEEQAERVVADLLGQETLAHLAINAGIGIAVPDHADHARILIDAADRLRLSRERGDAAAPRAPDPLVSVSSVSGLVRELTDHVVAMGGRLATVFQLAYIDPLSGLPNQQALTSFLQRELPRALRYRRSLTLFLVDGDNLKEFNSRFGFAAGDRWIRELGRLLERETRASDLVARWRLGDEFVVALPETDGKTAAALAQRIRDAVEQQGDRFQTSTTVSIGVATFPDDAETGALLLQQVEAANRRAKALGKNRIAFASDQDDISA